MKKKLAHYFRPALAALVLSAACAPAADPPELKLPEPFAPRVVKNVVKATATVDPNLKLINIEAAWVKSRGEGVTVFVADTGIDLKHPEFKGVAVEKYNFTSDPDASDSNGHGTFCASEIVGQQNVDGVAPRVKKLVVLKVLANDGRGDMVWLRKAVEFATKYDAGGGPKVFSGSLGATPNKGTDSPDAMPDLQKALREAIKAGVVFCFAAGNDDSKLAPNSVGWPARYNGLPGLDKLIVVAACDLTRKITDFSSVGPPTWVAAVGHNVRGALPDERYGDWDGTSMADPIIAGVVCCWLSAYGSAIPPADRQAAAAEALRLASSFADNRHPARGYGLPDCAKMFAAAPTNPPAPSPLPPADRTVTLDTPELRAAGIRRVVLTLDPAPAPTVPLPAPISVPARAWPVQHPQPVPGVWTQPVPVQCGPGGCGPAVPVQPWYPGRRVVQWIGR